VTDWTGATNPESLNDTLSILMDNIEKSSKAAASKTAGADLKSNEIFAMMGDFLAKGEGKEVIPKVQAVF
jgi:hypothetical protein